MSTHLLFSISEGPKTASAARQCPDDKPVVHCVSNPCSVAKCLAFPGAECRPNFCGGCNAEFFLGGAKINCGRLNLLVLFLICLELRSSVIYKGLINCYMSTEAIL